MLTGMDGIGAVRRARPPRLASVPSGGSRIRDRRHLPTGALCRGWTTVGVPGDLGTQLRSHQRCSPSRMTIFGGRPPDVLVLGGGGLLGEAWMTGVLAGIEDATGADMRSCRAYVGTSAGSIVSAS